jgi:glucose/arabinose dehydrogenase
MDQPADVNFDPQQVALGLEEVARDLNLPVFVTHAGDGSGRLFVVEKGGIIRLLPNGQIFLDISDRVIVGGSKLGTEHVEQGLLSLVFHPNFEANGFFYVNYIDLNGDTVVSRFTVTPDGSAGDPASEKVILQQDQPHHYHNGGMMAFGPDGFLYIALGDGGADPNEAQNLQTLLGSILRIDVDGGEPYAIPADNPFVDDATARPEIWSYGWRNPWRFSFDRATGAMYIADVGGALYEEVDHQPASSQGGENYGWPILEGSHCFNREKADQPKEHCDRTGLVEPVAEYKHGPGCAVTGGYVYRGQKYPMLRGAYLFGDYCSGQVWTLFQDQDGTWTMTEMLDTDALISSFGEDEAGELYLVDMVGGIVYRLTAE